MKRTSLLLDALFPRVRQRLLALMLLDPDRAWYLHELARRLEVPPSSIQREIARLVEAGVFTRRRDGNRVYYQANGQCPVFPELSNIFVKTAGVESVLRRALEPLTDQIAAAFIYGSLARAEDHAASDVDLMIVGGAPLPELAVALRPAEETLARPVNLTVYTTREFAQAIREGRHFLTAVMRGPKIFIHGTEADLEELA